LLSTKANVSTLLTLHLIAPNTFLNEITPLNKNIFCSLEETSLRACPSISSETSSVRLTAYSCDAQAQTVDGKSQTDATPAVLRSTAFKSTSSSQTKALSHSGICLGRFPNNELAHDFHFDGTANGRLMKILNVADESLKKPTH
jgi:hypothetical protein